MLCMRRGCGFGSLTPKEPNPSSVTDGKSQNAAPCVFARPSFALLSVSQTDLVLGPAGLFKSSVPRPVDGGDDLQLGRLQTLLQ